MRYTSRLRKNRKVESATFRFPSPACSTPSPKRRTQAIGNPRQDVNSHTDFPDSLPRGSSAESSADASLNRSFASGRTRAGPALTLRCRGHTSQCHSNKPVLKRTVTAIRTGNSPPGNSPALPARMHELPRVPSQRRVPGLFVPRRNNFSLFSQTTRNPPEYRPDFFV